jgi:hypothetical protein
MVFHFLGNAYDHRKFASQGNASKCGLLRQTLLRGKVNCRSLGFARDDKKGRADDRERVVAIGEGVGQGAS